MCVAALLHIRSSASRKASGYATRLGAASLLPVMAVSGSSSSPGLFLSTGLVAARLFPPVGPALHELGGVGSCSFCS